MATPSSEEARVRLEPASKLLAMCLLLAKMPDDAIAAAVAANRSGYSAFTTDLNDCSAIMRDCADFFQAVKAKINQGWDKKGA
jgi:hypothetical protein